jgi:hypothetical protein
VIMFCAVTRVAWRSVPQTQTTTDFHVVHSDKRRGNKASFGSLCEAYLSAFSLIFALWLDPACSSSDKILLEKYMSKVRMRHTAC